MPVDSLRPPHGPPTVVLSDDAVVTSPGPPTARRRRCALVRDAGDALAEAVEADRAQPEHPRDGCGAVDDRAGGRAGAGAAVQDHVGVLAELVLRLRGVRGRGA